MVRSRGLNKSQSIEFRDGVCTVSDDIEVSRNELVSFSIAATGSVGHNLCFTPVTGILLDSFKEHRYGVMFAFVAPVADADTESAMTKIPFA
jgi:hypothetical protein